MRATLVFNPAAGQREVRGHLRNVIGYLAENGWVVEWKETTPELSATELAREAVAGGAEVVIAAGGDGTINEVVNALVGHPDVRLGILPTGTANVWARESGLANVSLLGPNLEAAGEVLLNGVTMAVDVGRAGNRYFLLMAGAGLDALVTRRVDSRAKRSWGALAYAWTAIREAYRYRGAKMQITVDGVQVVRTAWLVTVSNSKLYALVPLAMEASMTDGLLDVGIFSGRQWPQFLRHTVNIILRRHMRDPEIEFLRGREIYITSSPPLPVQVDAEPWGQTPMSFSVVPQALHIIVPQAVSLQLSQPLPVAKS